VNSEVRIGRKEARRQLTARERQTYDRQKTASRGRKLTIRNDTWIAVLLKAGLPAPEALEKVIDTLIAEHREGGNGPDLHADRLFDPGLDDLAQLPVGLLDHKEPPLPDTLIPRSRDDLLALCERMIVLSRNPELIAYVVAGWPDSNVSRSEIRHGRRDAIDAATKLLERHVSELWRLNGVSTPLYEAIVTGRHGSALRILHSKPTPMGFTADGLQRLIERHGLIWCAHDLQLIVARARVAAENPFGAMIHGNHVELKPEAIANPLRRYLILLRLVMDLYATQAEEHDPIAPKPVVDELPKDADSTISSLAGRIRHSLGPMVAELVEDRTALDGLVVKMRTEKFHRDSPIQKILEQPVSANELSAHFSGIWFSGLSHVQVTGVAVLRYLQAERWIKRLAQEWHPDARIRTRIERDGPAMPPFDASEMASGWKGHARDLLQLYRRETLRDKMAPVPDVSLDPYSNAGDEVIKVARQYLGGQPQRRIEDCVGDVDSTERTLYLLDPIPETRLTR